MRSTLVIDMDWFMCGLTEVKSMLCFDLKMYSDMPAMRSTLLIDIIWVMYSKFKSWFHHLDQAPKIPQSGDVPYLAALLLTLYC